MARQLRLEIVIAMILTVFAVPVSAQKDMASCKPVLDATNKQIATPSHTYMSSSGENGTPTVTEAISAGGESYILYKGKWKRSPMTPKEMLEQQQENVRNAKAYFCRRVRDEVVNGVSTTLYSAHDDTGFSVNDAQIWIARGTGLPVKTESDLEVEKGVKKHYSARFEYSNVRPPIV